MVIIKIDVDGSHLRLQPCTSESTLRASRRSSALYPSPFDLPCRARERSKLGDAAGLTQFGVNFLRLPPGSWSSQRHWHTLSDEFIYVLEGEVTLVTDAGEELLKRGDAAGFKAGEDNGHCLQNRTDHDVTLLEIGSRIADDAAFYPDIDMMAPAGGKPAIYTHRDGTHYADLRRRGPLADTGQSSD
jgi:uncharacterized cupin superfamily protein